MQKEKGITHRSTEQINNCDKPDSAGVDASTSDSTSQSSGIRKLIAITIFSGIGVLASPAAPSFSAEPEQEDTQQEENHCFIRGVAAQSFNWELVSGECKDGTSNGIVEIKNDEGWTYKGELKHGLFHGKGLLISPNGDQYEGEWQDGKRHGNGSTTSKDGSKYTGSWRNDKANGYGTKTWPDGSSYEGEWKDGLEHGKGVYTDEHGTYTGEFQYGGKDGKGRMTWPEGSYIGDYKGGLEHGRGIVFSTGGSYYYEGNWRYGEMTGYGTMTSGETGYSGQFKKSEPHGTGVMTERDSEYKGEFVFSKAEGLGVISLTDGSTYQGEWRNNGIEGRGLVILPDGTKIVGHFKNMTSDGTGTILLPDGERYLGDLTGQMVFYRNPSEEDPEDVPQDGMWVDAEGMVYYGGLKKGSKRHGQGIQVETSGVIVVGEWSEGNFAEGMFDFNNSEYDTPEEIYDYAMGLLNEGYIEEAKTIFSDLAKDFPESPVGKKASEKFKALPVNK